MTRYLKNFAKTLAKGFAGGVIFGAWFSVFGVTPILAVVTILLTSITMGLRELSGDFRKRIYPVYGTLAFPWLLIFHQIREGIYQMTQSASTPHSTPWSLWMLALLANIGAMLWFKITWTGQVTKPTLAKACQSLSWNYDHGLSVVGQFNDFTVTVHAPSSPNKPNNLPSGMTVSIQIDRLPPGTRIENYTLLNKITEVATTQGVRMGDEHFDNKTFLSGDSVYLQAALSSNARQRLLRAIEQYEFRVHEGTLMLGLDNGYTQQNTLYTAIETAGRLAELLTLSAQEIPEKLARNAKSDPVAAVRQRNFQQLLKTYAGANITKELSLHMLKKGDVWSRLKAACYLLEQGEGEKVTNIIETLIGDDMLPDNVINEALDHLARLNEHEIMLGALRSESPEVVENALKHLVSANYKQAMGHIMSRLTNAIYLDDHIKAELCWALGYLGNASSVELLIQIRDSLPAFNVALGGSQGKLDHRAEEAIARIQSQLDGAYAGQMTLVEPQKGAGAMSLAANPGRLSLEQAGERHNSQVSDTSQEDA